MTKTKKINKIKNYALLAKANPIRAYLDLVNLVLILTVFSIAFYIFNWVSNVFVGNQYANPVLFKIGYFKLYWHGLILALATLASVIYIARNYKKAKMESDHIAAIIFWTIILGIFGGKIAFVLISWDSYSQNAFQILNIWEGGLSFYGALAGGCIAILVYSAIRRINAKKVLDLFAPAIFLGLTIGSWGSFFNHEKIGKPTYSFLKMFVEVPDRPWIYQKFSYFHPIFLYEFITFLALFIALLVIKKKKKLESGTLFALAVIAYSLVKFLIGFLAVGGSIIWIFNLTQITSIIFAIIAIIGLYFLRKKNDETQ